MMMMMMASKEKETLSKVTMDQLAITDCNSILSDIYRASVNVLTIYRQGILAGGKASLSLPPKDYMHYVMVVTLAAISSFKTNPNASIRDSSYLLSVLPDANYPSPWKIKTTEPGRVQIVDGKGAIIGNRLLTSKVRAFFKEHPDVEG